MSDLDLLVQSRDVNAVVQRLACAGYFTPAELDPLAGRALEYENEVAVSKPDGTRYRFDVHWSLLAAPYYQHRVPPDWFWATSLPVGTASNTAAGFPARVLGPEAQVLHLAAHLILQHHGQGLMWWQDVGEVVWAGRRQIDWDVLCERACAYDLVLPVQQVLLDLIEHWRLPIPVEAS